MNAVDAGPGTVIMPPTSFRVHARVAKLVDAVDSKSTGLIPRAGSSPASGTIFKSDVFLIKALNKRPPALLNGADLRNTYAPISFAASVIC